MTRVVEERGTLWLLTVAPTIWAAHLLLSYVTAAVWCAKFAAARDAPIGGVRLAVLAYTIAALIGIGLTWWRGYRHHSSGNASPPHDADTPEDQHRFLGFATVLLAGLSAVATLYVALVAIFFETCR